MRGGDWLSGSVYLERELEFVELEREVRFRRIHRPPGSRALCRYDYVMKLTSPGFASIIYRAFGRDLSDGSGASSLVLLLVQPFCAPGAWSEW